MIKGNRIRLYFIVSIVMFTMLKKISSQTTDCLTVLKAAGKELAYPRLSMDEKKILYQTNESGKWQLKTLDLGTGAATSITNDTSNNNFPDWSFNNEWITFVSDRDGNEEIYLMKTNGSALKRLTNHPARDIHPYFSPDGKYILFNSTRGNGSFDIFRYTIKTGKTEQITNTAQNETCARYSPDMKTIVYLKNDNYSDDVFMLDISNFLSTNLTQTPSAMDGWPMFNHDGKWIYFSSMENNTYSIYRIKPDGSEKHQITFASAPEEHARVCIGSSGKMIVYNVGKPGEISLYSCKLIS